VSPSVCLYRVDYGIAGVCGGDGMDGFIRRVKLDALRGAWVCIFGIGASVGKEWFVLKLY
jgi:hypothetical protein